MASVSLVDDIIVVVVDVVVRKNLNTHTTNKHQQLFMSSAIIVFIFFNHFAIDFLLSCIFLFCVTLKLVNTHIFTYGDERDATLMICVSVIIFFCVILSLMHKIKINFNLQ